MIRHILLALGLSLSFMTVWNSASMSRSFTNDTPASSIESHRPMPHEVGPRGPDRSGYIVASS